MVFAFRGPAAGDPHTKDHDLDLDVKNAVIIVNG
jgi:hypothetical protein